MEWKNKLTRTPYLVLFTILIAIGVGTASAMITITLAGNVIITDDLTVDTDTLVVDSSGNKIGIGTTSPTSAVHITEGGGHDFSPNQDGIQLTGSDSGGNAGIELTTNGGTPFIDFQNDTSGTDYDARIILRDNDNLEVRGANLDVRDGPIFSHRNSGSNTANLVIERSGGPTADDVQFTFSHRSTDKDLWLYGFDGTTFKNFVGFDFPNYKITFPSAGDTLVIDGANGKVGIGTSNPSETLDVNGLVKADGLTGMFNVFEVGFYDGVGGGNHFSTGFLNATDGICFITAMGNSTYGDAPFAGSCEVSIVDGSWQFNVTGFSGYGFMCRASCLSWN